MNASVRLLAVALAAVAVTACSSSGPTVRQEPPGVQLENLRLDDGRARIGVLLHNPNDHPIQVRTVELEMSVAGNRLFSDRWSVMLDIGARGRERLGLETRGELVAARQLAELDGRPDARTRYRLRAAIGLAEEEPVAREREGYLHPVPGQPGSYR
jgi:hypothetical protein